MASMPNDWTGQTLSNGRYAVRAILGEGGMGLVYHGWDNNLGQEVVIKVPRQQSHDDADFSTRFAHEIRSLVQLTHPHVVKVLDVGEQGGLPFAVIQFLAGGSLESQRVRQPSGEWKPIALANLKKWLPMIADALDFVHSQGYIHRDVKPANILFDRYGNAYLSDFGVARVLDAARRDVHTATEGWIFGTPEYMAPELILGRTIDGRVDQYALAVTVFEMMTGRFPYNASSPKGVMLAHTTSTIPNPQTLNPLLPDPLSRAVMLALSKTPRDRFPNCMAFAQAVCGLGNAPAEPISQPPLKRGRWSAIVDQRAACPSCGRSIAVSPRSRGTRAKCPACSTMLEVSQDLQQLFELQSSEFAVQPQHPIPYRLSSPKTIAVPAPTPALEIRIPEIQIPLQIPSVKLPAISSPSVSISPRTKWVMAATLASALAIFLGVTFVTSLVPSEENSVDAGVSDGEDRSVAVSEMIAAWQVRHDRMYKMFQGINNPVVSTPRYASSQELQGLFDAWFQDVSFTVIDDMRKLTDDLEAIRRVIKGAITDNEKRLAQSVKTGSGVPPSEITRLHRLLDNLRDRDLNTIELEGKLNALERNLADGGLARDPAVQRELTTMREIERIVSLKQAVELTPAARTRAIELVRIAKNPKLVNLAINALARSGDTSIHDPIQRELSSSNEATQADLCLSLLLSGNASSIRLAANHILKHPTLCNQLDRVSLLAMLAENPNDYKALLPRIAERCHGVDEQLRLLGVQCQLRDDAFLADVQRAFDSDLFKNHVGDAVNLVLTHQWRSAYPLAAKLIEKHPTASLDKLTPASLEAARKGDPALAAKIVEQAIVQGTKALRESAIKLLRDPQIKIDIDRLFRRIQSEQTSELTGLFNLLCSSDTERSTDLAKWLAQDATLLVPGQIHYPGIPESLSRNEATRTSLIELAWKAPGEGQSWAIQQLLGNDFANRFKEIEFKRGEQEALFKQVEDVLGGRLVPHKYADGTYASDLGLQLTSSQVNDLGPLNFAPWSADGAYLKSVTELRSTIEKARSTADARYADHLGKVDTYLKNIDEATKCVFELAKVFNDTVGKELPKAKDEVNKKGFKTWGFRFVKNNRDLFDRNRQKYNETTFMLDSAYRNLPLFLTR
jgi:serine/threonine protein kinase